MTDENKVARDILRAAVEEMRDDGVSVEIVIGCMVAYAVGIMSSATSPKAAAQMLRHMADMTDKDEAGPSSSAEVN